MPASEQTPAADPVEPHYKSLTVALVPQPRQIPPPPFEVEDLQRIFSDVLRHHAYQSFEFTFGGRGAQFTNGPEDTVEIRPALFQVQAKMDGPDVLTASAATDKAQRILKIAADRLKVEGFLQSALQVLATVPAPDDDSVAFIGTHLMRNGEKAKILGPDYIAGGVRFRNLFEDRTGEEVVSIEPLLQDFSSLYVEYHAERVATAAPFSLDQASSWTAEAFEFVGGPTMALLSP
jgi:hypothetical protein